MLPFTLNTFISSFLPLSEAVVEFSSVSVFRRCDLTRQRMLKPLPSKERVIQALQCSSVHLIQQRWHHAPLSLLSRHNGHEMQVFSVASWHWSSHVVTTKDSEEDHHFYHACKNTGMAVFKARRSVLGGGEGQCFFYGDNFFKFTHLLCF